MHTQTDPADRPWTLADLYDLVMERVEPELTLGRMGELDRLYANESEEQRQVRAERYARAFKTCFSLMEQLMHDMTTGMDAFRRDLIKQLRGKEIAEHDEQVKRLEQSLDDA